MIALSAILAKSLNTRSEDIHRRLWWYLIIMGSVFVRLSGLEFESDDYKVFLSKWYDVIVEHGRWASLKEEFCNQAPLYQYCLTLSTLLPLSKLYGIKLISIICDYVGAWFFWRLINRRFPNNGVAVLGTAAFLFLPTVILNSAVWGQCDIMYTTALLATIYYILEKRGVATLIAFGLAASLKPQAIFLFPFLAALFLQGRLPWRLFWISPAVYMLAGLPAIIAGRPLTHVVFHYARQANLRGLTLGATNWYLWGFDIQPELLWWAGVMLALAATSAFILFVVQSDIQCISDRWLICGALLSVLYLPYFLPGMHERYLFPADIVSLVYAFYVPRKLWIAVAIQLTSFFTYFPYLFKTEPIPRPYLAVVMTGALVAVAVEFVKGATKLAGNNVKNCDYSSRE